MVRKRYPIGQLPGIFREVVSERFPLTRRTTVAEYRNCDLSTGWLAGGYLASDRRLVVWNSARPDERVTSEVIPYAINNLFFGYLAYNAVIDELCIVKADGPPGGSYA